MPSTGVKLPSNADKRRSGTHEALLHDAQRLETAVEKMLEAHRQDDDAIKPRTSTARRIERLQGEARRIREFLATHAERRSAKGTVRMSNVTDNDSAKMATQKGVIQGYPAVAAATLLNRQRVRDQWPCNHRRLQDRSRLR